jgi:tRNA pseudouridine38-40 synthase
MRYFIEIQYYGPNFSGWQIQPNATSVQEIIEYNLSLLLKEKMEVVGAGRTDAGVHASSQWAHFDTVHEPQPDFLYRLNQMLPHSMAIKTLAKPARENLHARFDAIRRSYLYKIARKKNPFLFGQTWLNQWKIDVQKMQEASNILLEYQDFKSFEKTGGNNMTSNCQIFNAHWNISSDIWEFHISANRFLRGMVRAIVGTLVECGKGKISLDEFRQIIESKDRKNAAQNAPPEGLYLCEVFYGDNNLIILQQ